MSNSIHSPSGFTKELSLAKEIALKAGEIMRHYFDGDQHEQTKSDGTPVTIADKIINAMVIGEIAKHFPYNIIVGDEESTGSYGMGRQWICDPIDGTKSYTIGIPTSMFSLAFIVDGIPMVAITFEPQLNKMYSAIRGQGSFCNNKKIHVSNNNLEKAKLAVPPDYIKSHFLEQRFMKRLLAYDKQLTLFDGAVYRGCTLANGRIDGFPHPETKPWDIAAIHLIVEEAGGKVTDIHGNPITYTKDFRGAVFSNGVIHNDLLALFKD